jgi:hypothetical protein
MCSFLGECRDLRTILNSLGNGGFELLLALGRIGARLVRRAQINGIHLFAGVDQKVFGAADLEQSERSFVEGAHQ